MGGAHAAAARRLHGETRIPAPRARAMEPGAGTPWGVALTGHVGPTCPGERSPCLGRVQGGIRLPDVPMEKLPCHEEPLTATAKRLQEMSDIAEVPEMPTEPPAEALPPVPSPEPARETGNDPSEIKLPPWLGKWGTCREEVPVEPLSPPKPAEQPSQPVTRRGRPIRTWLGEKVVDPLNSGLGQELGSEDSAHHRGFHGLPLHQFLSSLTDSSTTDTYRPPHRALLLQQGLRKATLASMLYEKYSRETEEKIRPRPQPMESVSTTHRDYAARGFQPTPPSITQPHNYLTEQPTSFWLEQARGVPVSPPAPHPASTPGVSAADRDLSPSLLSRVSLPSSAETFPSRGTQPSPLPSLCT
ncbi:sperm-associated antigen 8 [Manacus candei]|uniref:sperm-associated antigen 8 n=1 Tax=Manacus candei TaxID=415023 RepID=UPI002225F957|nr:sperm-associated antigen 8 [Manacus candei]